MTRGGLCTALALLVAASCGDVKSELIVDPSEGEDVGFGQNAGAAGTASGGIDASDTSSGGTAAGGNDNSAGTAGSATTDAGNTGGTAGATGGAGGAAGNAGTAPDASPPPECTTAADCPAPGGSPDEALCDDARGVCVECTQPGHCGASEDCNHLIGECADRCTTNADCGFDESICDSATDLCVECLSDGDCDADESCVSTECV